MKDIKVKDIMTRGAITIFQEATVIQAIQILSDNDISGIVVISQKGEIVGIISDTDIIKVLNEDVNNILVKDVMTTPVITINKDALISEAWKQMKSQNIHRLVVFQEVSTKEETPKKHFASGIVSISDIIRAIKNNS
ncbi:MAG: CBS domain-containing protein [bacterium]|nr:CBS domain-containing protein [bacterium]